MATLQVRDFPEELHKQIVDLAESEHRSLAQQITVLLKQALEHKEANRHRRGRVLDSIQNSATKKNGRKFSDPTKLLREDRER